VDFCRESLPLELIRELPELVEIDTRPEPEGMGNRLRRGMASGRDDAMTSPMPGDEWFD
jgi:hypothetical protein